MAVNPFCEIAIEEAIRIKESGNAEEVVVVTVGDENIKRIRTALALGATEPFMSKLKSSSTLDVAKVL